MCSTIISTHNHSISVRLHLALSAVIMCTYLPLPRCKYSMNFEMWDPWVPPMTSVSPIVRGMYPCTCWSNLNFDCSLYLCDCCGVRPELLLSVEAVQRQHAMILVCFVRYILCIFVYAGCVRQHQSLHMFYESHTYLRNDESICNLHMSCQGVRHNLAKITCSLKPRGRELIGMCPGLGDVPHPVYDSRRSATACERWRPLSVYIRTISVSTLILLCILHTYGSQQLGASLLLSQAGCCAPSVLHKCCQSIFIDDLWSLYKDSTCFPCFCDTVTEICCRFYFVCLGSEGEDTVSIFKGVPHGSIDVYVCDKSKKLYDHVPI